jgi:hypothetical protein
MTASRGVLLLSLCLLVCACGVKPVNAPGAPVDSTRADAGGGPPDAAAPPLRPEVGPPPACSGDGCSGQELGARCDHASQCASGFCADGVCCNGACAGACMQCNLPDRAGECAPSPAGQPDPHRQCRQDAPESCGQSGVCNGQGGCSKFPAGTRCGAAACDGNRQIPAGECDGAGLCIQGAAIDCAPFTCESGGLPAELRGRRPVHPAQRVRWRQLREAGQGPDLHCQRPVRKRFLRGRCLLRWQLHGPLPLLCLPRRARDLHRRACRCARSAGRQRGHRSRPGLPGPGGQLVRHRRAV